MGTQLIRGAVSPPKNYSAACRTNLEPFSHISCCLLVKKDLLVNQPLFLLGISHMPAPHRCVLTCIKTEPWNQLNDTPLVRAALFTIPTCLYTFSPFGLCYCLPYLLRGVSADQLLLLIPPLYFHTKH